MLAASQGAPVTLYYSPNYLPRALTPAHYQRSAPRQGSPPAARHILPTHTRSDCFLAALLDRCAPWLHSIAPLLSRALAAATACATRNLTMRVPAHITHCA